MRPLLLSLVALTGIGVGLVAGNLRLTTVQIDPNRAMSTAPDLALTDVANEVAERPDDAARRTEYCGTTRRAVVRRVTQLGDAEALVDILPPIRWEAWPDVVRACESVYGPLTPPPRSANSERGVARVGRPPHPR